MKNLLLLIAIAFTLSCKAQQTIVNITTLDYHNDNSNKYFKDIDGLYDPFLGTWEYTTGTTTFRVKLVKTTSSISEPPYDYKRDWIEGKFYIIENAGLPNEVITCQSEKYYYESNSTWTYVIRGSTPDGINLGGFIYDNCTTDLSSSSLKMTIVDPNATILTANWHVFKKGMTVGNYTYAIPTNVVLTKQ